MKIQKNIDKIKNTINVLMKYKNTEKYFKNIKLQ